MKHISACTLDCPDCCSTIVSVHDDGSLSIKGNPEHPITQGFTCKKAKHALTRIADPKRITTPLMRKGDNFTPVSWEKALDAIANKISSLQNTPERMLHIRGYGFRGVIADTSRYLFGKLGASATRGALCDNAIIEASILDFGELDQNDPAELLNADYIVNWGRDVFRSSVHTAKLFNEARAAGCKIISISPASPEEGQRIHLSDKHIQLRPGTDRFLAAAVLARLSETGFSDAITRHISNSTPFLSYLNTLKCNELLKLCGVSLKEFELLFSVYSDESQAVSTIIGWGLQRYVFGGENVRFINALSMLSGNVGKKGAGSYAGFSTGRNFNSTWRSRETPPRKLLLPKLADEILKAGDIEFLWCDGTNAINQTPNAVKMAEAFTSIDMVVVVDAFMNDTAKRADIILPCALIYEKEDILGSYFHNYIQHSAKVVEPTGEAKADYDIIRELAERLNIPFPDRNAILQQALDTPAITNLTEKPLEMIRKKGFLPTDRKQIAFSDFIFGHPDGKYQLPEPYLHPEPQRDASFPLTLLSLINKDYEHSQIPEEQQQEQLKAYLHPTTLEQNGIEPESSALLVSPIGKLPIQACADSTVHPEAVIIRRGGWMMYNRSPNAIIEEHITDVGDNAAYYSQRVRIESV